MRAPLAALLYACIVLSALAQLEGARFRPPSTRSTFDRNSEDHFQSLHEKWVSFAVQERSSRGLPSEACLLREWPWTSWDNGPICPPRNQFQFNALDVDAPVLKAAFALADDVISGYFADLEAVNIHTGAYFTVVYNDQVLFSKAYGTLTPGGDMATEDTVYNIGSVTKIFTSLAFMATVENGTVGLDSRVTDFYNENSPPAFAMHNPYSDLGADAVTLHSLAMQSAGLPREAPCGIYPLVSYDPGCGNGTEEATNFEYLNNFPLVFPPYTRSTYSNLGLSLLGRSLERVWGEPYEEFMEQSILSQIGMASSGFVYTPDVLDNMAQGWDVIGPVNANGSYIQVPSTLAVGECNDEGECRSAVGWCAPAAAMFTSTKDLQTFFKMLFAEKDTPIMSRSTMNQFMLPGALLPDAISAYGLGTWEMLYSGCYWTLTKGGLVDGFSAELAVVPELKLGTSILVNINSGYATSTLSATTMLVLEPAILAALAEVQQAYRLPTNYTDWLGHYSGVLSLEEGEYTTVNGVLAGSLFGTAQFFVWEESLSSSTQTAFRYSTSDASLSCLTSSETDNFGIAYFSMKEHGPVVSIINENISVYNVKRSPVEAPFKS